MRDLVVLPNRGLASGDTNGDITIWDPSEVSLTLSDIAPVLDELIQYPSSIKQLSLRGIALNDAVYRTLIHIVELSQTLVSIDTSQTGLTSYQQQGQVFQARLIENQAKTALPQTQDHPRSYPQQPGDSDLVCDQPLVNQPLFVELSKIPSKREGNMNSQPTAPTVSRGQGGSTQETEWLSLSNKSRIASRGVFFQQHTPSPINRSAPVAGEDVQPDLAPNSHKNPQLKRFS